MNYRDVGTLLSCRSFESTTENSHFNSERLIFSPSEASEILKRSKNVGCHLE